MQLIGKCNARTPLPLCSLLQQFLPELFERSQTLVLSTRYAFIPAVCTTMVGIKPLVVNLNAWCVPAGECAHAHASDLQGLCPHRAGPQTFPIYLGAAFKQDETAICDISSGMQCCADAQALWARVAVLLDQTVVHARTLQGATLRQKRTRYT